MLERPTLPGSGKPNDLTDQRFGKLVAETYVPGGPPKYKSSWLCICDCGNIKLAKTENLKRGKTKSCGCDHHEIRVAQVTKHGHANSNNGRPSGTYQSWHAMRQRCERPSHKQFADYGGRGIKVCASWRSFESFLEDMGERPDGKTIDRWPDVNGNYEPGNCRWATLSEQAVNKRPKIKNMDAIPLLAAAERVIAADNDNLPRAIVDLRAAVQSFKERAA